jgi:peptidoglycan-associated lipoprotein
MTEVSRPLFRACVYAAMFAATLTLGCHPKPKPVPQKPVEQAPPPAPAQPTVTLSADPTSIKKGASSTLSWTSTNATQLTVAPEVGTVNAQGSTQVSPSDSTEYTITASGPGGSATATARITVEAPPPPKVEPAPDLNDLFTKEVHDAYFDFNKADIRADAREALGKTADFLRNYPQIRVTIEGHCDERGSTEYNLALGDRRAAAAKQYLVSLGISADRVNTVSFGKEKQFCSEHNESCWQQNRRGHFVRAQ